MNYKNNSKIIEAAIAAGCKTMKEFAKFLKEHKPSIEINPKEKKIIQPSLSI